MLVIRPLSINSTLFLLLLPAAKGQIDAVCLDMSKAFDRVPHAQLIEKLVRLGINKKLIEWLKSYLSNRTQFVEINGVKSRILSVTSGVPQGSVLGPVLFLCYINNIAETVSPNIRLRLFTDDCLIYSRITHRKDQLALNAALNNLGDWCNKWKMKVNYCKTSYMTVTKNVKNVLAFSYRLDGHELERVTHFKYLGVTLSEDLSWKTHIDHLCSVAEKKLWFLRRKLKLASTKAKLTAYLTLVRPTLEYASIIWDPYRKYQIDKIEKIQRRAARLILSRFRSTDSVSDMLSHLNLPSLSD